MTKTLANAFVDLHKTILALSIEENMGVYPIDAFSKWMPVAC